MGTGIAEAGQRFVRAADRHLYCAEQMQALARDLAEEAQDNLVEQMARQATRQILMDLASAEIEIARKLIETASEGEA
jgi:hypothetical protein